MRGPAFGAQVYVARGRGLRCAGGGAAAGLGAAVALVGAALFVGAPGRGKGGRRVAARRPRLEPAPGRNRQVSAPLLRSVHGQHRARGARKEQLNAAEVEVSAGRQRAIQTQLATGLLFPSTKPGLRLPRGQ